MGELLLAGATLTRLGLTPSCHDVVDVGCGYGTFSIPAARMVRSTVHALDIEVEMVATASHKAVELGLTNVRVERRDFVAEGTELPDVTYRCWAAPLTNRRPSVTIQVITARTFDPAGAWWCLDGERFYTFTRAGWDDLLCSSGVLRETKLQ